MLKKLYIKQQEILWNIQNKHIIELDELKKMATQIYRLSGNPSLNYSKLSDAGFLNQHSINVAILIGFLGHALELQVGLIKRYIMGGLLHDMGKLFTVPSILDKPGKLDTMEVIVVKAHAFVGHLIAAEFVKDPIIENIVLLHHSIEDNKELVTSLEVSPEILGAYICYVADIVDAMLSFRSYKIAYPPQPTMVELKKREVNPQIIELLSPIILPVERLPLEGTGGR